MSSIRLSDTQLVILTAAAGRDDGTVLSVPKSLTIRGGAADKVFTSLLKRGLVEERTVAPGDTAWREGVGLAITAAGIAAIGAEPADPARESPTKTRASSKRTTQGPKIRAGTKQALLLDLLKRQTGATIAEISKATGWQAHSVRGVISGAVKKKLGLDVTSEIEESRGRVYRVTGDKPSAEGA